MRGQHRLVSVLGYPSLWFGWAVSRMHGEAPGSSGLKDKILIRCSSSLKIRRRWKTRAPSR
jgi:hypothetical protein